MPPSHPIPVLCLGHNLVTDHHADRSGCDSHTCLSHSANKPKANISIPCQYQLWLTSCRDIYTGKDRHWRWGAFTSFSCCFLNYFSSLFSVRISRLVTLKSEDNNTILKRKSTHLHNFSIYLQCLNYKKKKKLSLSSLFGVSNSTNTEEYR